MDLFLFKFAKSPRDVSRNDPTPFFVLFLTSRISRRFRSWIRHTMSDIVPVNTNNKQTTQKTHKQKQLIRFKPYSTNRLCRVHTPHAFDKKTPNFAQGLDFFRILARFETLDIPPSIYIYIYIYIYSLYPRSPEKTTKT